MSSPLPGFARALEHAFRALRAVIAPLGADAHGRIPALVPIRVRNGRNDRLPLRHSPHRHG